MQKTNYRHGIGSASSTPTDIASCTYTPNGDVEQEIRNGGTLLGSDDAREGQALAASARLQGSYGTMAPV